ncbi:AtpZ/AtpI family protein [Bacillus carboniphilus]|uniref:AtpZ/AtpI family protein n=1 Tax=Bacillus carboniphilus TaxID=86663 RepID=A0ABN0VXQ2_9BACI
MKKKDHHPFRAMALMSAITSQLVGCILVGVFGGRWLDGAIGTEPLFLILGLLTGLGAGIFGMLQLIRHFNAGD